MSFESNVAVSADTDQIAVSAEELTFTTELWWTPQSIQVSVIDDDLSGDLAEGDPHATTIAHSVSSTDVAYSELEVDYTKVSILDNDCGSWDYNSMDFDEDCDVDLNDFVVVGSEWMFCTTPYAEGCIKME
jgi:hypothetical protein